MTATSWGTDAMKKRFNHRKRYKECVGQGKLSLAPQCNEPDRRSRSSRVIGHQCEEEATAAEEGNKSGRG